MADLAILGGGIAGISAAYHAKAKGIDYSLYEATDSAGGLLDNFMLNGFRFDNAVHLSFTKDSYVRSIFDQSPYNTHNPEAYNYYQGKWLKHPVQNNLFKLSSLDKVKLIKSIIDAPNIEVNNYKEWLYNQFGEYFCEKFNVPYTRKYWGIEPEILGTDWVGPRIRKANIEEVLLGAFSEETPDYYYANEMRYPKNGGYKKFIEPMIHRIKINLNYNAIEVDLKNKYIIFENGIKKYYNNLICTIPLPLFTTICKNIPRSIKEISDTLYASEVDLISVGFNCPDIPKHLWFYIYDENILPARAYSPSLKSPDNTPINSSSLQFEIYSTKHRKIKISQSSLQEKIVSYLNKMGIARTQDILFTHHKKLNYGNVIFDIGMEKRRDFVKSYFDDKSILFSGRFGEWEYFWSDQSLLSGRNAIEKINRQTINEVHYRNPNVQ